MCLTVGLLNGGGDTIVELVGSWAEMQCLGLLQGALVV